MSCECDLCRKEAEWEAVYATCYRCSHDLPCQLAEENGDPCVTVLDRIVDSLEEPCPSSE